VPQSEDTDQRGGEAAAVPAREGSAPARALEGHPVRGRRAGAQAADAAQGRRQTLIGRLGLAIVNPRAALAIAGGRDHAGRSGTDLLLAIVVLIIATRLRVLVQAGWTGAVLGAGNGARLVIQLLADTLTIDLGILVIAAVITWAAAGPRRELGRSFDLACVAVLPLVAIDLVAGVVIHALDVAVPIPVTWILTALAYAWTGSLVSLAMLEARRPSFPGTGGRAAGLVLAVVAAAGVVTQGVWIARNLDMLRPMSEGNRAPAFALHSIGPHGELGPVVALAPGRPAVIDFWASWCNPCLKSLPHLQAFAKHHPEVSVYAISIDDNPADAREVFDQKGYTLTLLADDHATRDRYGVASVPHTVVVDRNGYVRRAGTGLDLEAELAHLQ
jgi:thiol-disulfide isomerase/thioredoxin